MMLRFALPLLLVAPIVLAAPIPKESESDKLRRLFGTPEDPDKVCKFSLDGNQLRLTAAKGLRGLNPARGLTNAPRALKTVRGDFEATVRIVRDTIAEGTKKADEVYTPSGGGGLLLWVDADSHLRLSRSQWVAEAGGQAKTTYNLRGARSKEEFAGWVTNVAEGDTEPVTFRMTRTGNKIASAYSRDGKKWATFDTLEMDLPDEVKIGVYVAHNFDKPLEVVFEPLVIDQRK
jgi:hypothetical protein